MSKQKEEAYISELSPDELHQYIILRLRSPNIALLDTVPACLYRPDVQIETFLLVENWLTEMTEIDWVDVAHTLDNRAEPFIMRYNPIADRLLQNQNYIVQKAEEAGLDTSLPLDWLREILTFPFAKELSLLGRG